MPENIFASKFFNRDRVPAWWDINQRFVSQGDCTAQQALDGFGDYRVTKVPLYINISDVVSNPEDLGGEDAKWHTNYSIIVRDPVDDDPEYRIFGSPVHKDYELITPRGAAQIVDRAWGNTNGSILHPIETMGVLGKGEVIFITTKTDSYDILGDEIARYMYLHSPMYSGKAAHCGTTDIRIVCQNTLNQALENSQDQWMVVHTPGASEELETWLRNTRERFDMTGEVTREAYLLMAKKKVTKTDEMPQIEWIYPNPPQPTLDMVSYARVPMERLQENYETKMDTVVKMRQIVLDLFHGDGTGMDSRACKGTSFGLYNAVAELETYKKGNGEQAAVGLLIGDRGSRIRRAFTSLYAYSQS